MLDLSDCINLVSSHLTLDKKGTFKLHRNNDLFIWQYILSTDKIKIIVITICDIISPISPSSKPEANGQRGQSQMESGVSNGSGQVIS